MDLLDNEHGNKVGVNINLQPNYVTWSSPESFNEKSPSNTQRGCWSKGRYCYWQTDNDTRAKQMLRETLLQACLNIVAKPNSDKDTENISKLQSYYEEYTNAINNNLFGWFDDDNKLSKELKEEIQKCYDDSWVTKDKKPFDPLLDDNKILEKEKIKFHEVAAYENFPLLKVNGFVYPKHLDWNNVMKFT